MDQDRHIEKLHEQASADYLEGEFASAMRVWRELLELDPQDERALDGVRLCELLARETDRSAVFGAPDATQATATPMDPAATLPPVPMSGTPALPAPADPRPVRQAPAQYADVDPFGELDDLLSDDDGSEPMTAPAAMPEPPSVGGGFELGDLDEVEAPAPSSGTEASASFPSIPAAPPASLSVGRGFELSDLDEVEAPAPSSGTEASASLPSKPSASTGDALEFGDLPGIEADPAVVGAPAPAAESGDGGVVSRMGEAAAAELRARIDELMIEATRAYETGDLDAAQGVLDRVFILDEEHPGATALQQQIQQDLPDPADGSHAAAPASGEPAGAYSAEPPPGLDGTSLGDPAHSADEPLAFDTDLLGDPESGPDGESSALFDPDAVAGSSDPPPATAAVGPVPDKTPGEGAEFFDTESVSDTLFDPGAAPEGASAAGDPDAEPLDELDLGDDDSAAFSDEATATDGGDEGLQADAPASELEDGGLSEPEPEPTRDAKKESSSRKSGPGIGARLADGLAGLSSIDNRTKGIVAGAAVLVLALGGWFGFQLLGADPENAALDEQVRNAKALTKNKARKAETKEKEPAGKALDAAGLGVASSAEEIAETMVRADAAFEARDWQAAIVAYNRVLELDAGNAAAVERFKQASDAYRAQNEYEDKLISAIAMFDRGDYRSALKSFYRLPGASDDPRFDRYKAHGWHNLGVAALQVNDSVEAQSHFAEVEVLSPSDPDLPKMIELSRRCRQARVDPDYRAEVDALPLRSLDH